MGRTVTYTCDKCGKQSKPIYKIGYEIDRCNEDYPYDINDREYGECYLCEACKHEFASKMRGFNFKTEIIIEDD